MSLGVEVSLTSGYGHAAPNHSAIVAALAVLDGELSRATDAEDHYAGGCVFFPPGRYFVAGGIEVKRHGIRLLGNRTQLVFTRLTGPAVAFGPATDSASTTDNTANIGSGIEGIDLLRFGVDWGDDALTSEDIGLELHNCLGFSAVDLSVGSFTVGIVLSAGTRLASLADLATGGNRLELRSMVDNKVGVLLWTERISGYVFSTTFVGGRFEIARTELDGAPIVGTRHVLVQGERCSDVSFYGTAFLGLPEVGVQIGDDGLAAAPGEAGVHTTLFSGCWFDGEGDAQGGGSQACIRATGQGTALTAGTIWHGSLSLADDSQPSMRLGTVARRSVYLDRPPGDDFYIAGMGTFYNDDGYSAGLSVFAFPELTILPAPHTR